MNMTHGTSSRRTLVALGAAAALALVISASCDREDRDLESPPSAADTAKTVQISPLIPGVPDPTTQPTQLQPGKRGNPYEENAYAMAEGQKLYVYYNCQGCHAKGGGDIGPPLMDNKWIYGSSSEQIVSTIVQGRPNGMPAFGTKIPDYQIWQIAAYVRSMSGLVRFDAAPAREDHMQTTPPPNTKDPEKPVQGGSTPPGAEMPQ